MKRSLTEIGPGTILIAKDAIRPQCFQVEDDLYPDSWMTVRHNLTPDELAKELATSGWTFFYMANSISMTSSGFNRGKMIEAALKRAITAVKLQRCNCLQIDDVLMHSFLGMPYISVSAHPRHIQKGMVFSG